MLAVVSIAQFLGMTLWFSATAVTPLLIYEFNISQAHAPWLTMAVQAGFVAGTLFSALSNIADTLNSRTLMFVGSLIGGARERGRSARARRRQRDRPAIRDRRVARPRVSAGNEDRGRMVS